MRSLNSTTYGKLYTIRSRRYPSFLSLCEGQGDVPLSMLYLYNSGKCWVLEKWGLFFSFLSAAHASVFVYMIILLSRVFS